MMPPPMAATFWKGKPNRAELESYAADPRKLLARMDADEVDRVGLINYVSPDLMGFTDAANAWMVQYAGAGSVARCSRSGRCNPRFSADVGGETARVIERAARALKVHPPHQLFRANAYQDALPGLADLYRVAQDAGVPVTIHTGTSVFPGARSRFGDPMDVDDVAIDFPKLTIPAGARRAAAVDGGRVLPRPPAPERPPRGVRAFPVEAAGVFSAARRDCRQDDLGHGLAEPGIKSMKLNVEAFRALPLSDGAEGAILDGNARDWA